MSTTTIDPVGPRVFCTECGRPYAPEDVVRFGTNVVCAQCKPAFVQRMQEGAYTGAAVLYGGFWRRFVAIILDAIILGIIMFPISMLLAFVVGTGLSMPRHGPVPVPNIAGVLAVTYLVQIAIAIAYQVFFLTRKGATPGKMILGMKVITATGGPITAGRAVGRYFAQLLSGFTLAIGYIIAAFDSEKRALHDHICSTRVIRTV